MAADTCEVIQEAAILLDLPQVAAATAQVFFHRFYRCRSTAENDMRLMAMASLFLAAKVEECPRRMRDVLGVFNALFDRREGAPVEPLDIHSERYARMKRMLARAEGEVLKELGFVLYTEHPHKFILNYVKLLCDDPKTERELAQKAWNTINDSLRTDLCLRFPPEVVCCGAIAIGARLMQLALPEPWWEVFEVAKADLDTVTRVMVDLYQGGQGGVSPSEP